MKRVHRLVGPQGQRLTLIGGILGLAADADLVRAEFSREKPASVQLGIPFEDLDAIRGTAGKEAEVAFESSDLDDHYFERLKRFGAVKTPPTDLYAAYALADAAKIPVGAIDLGDEAHTDAYTRHVGIFEVIRSNRTQRKLPARRLSDTTAEEFAIAWDAALHATKGLRKVQQAREAWMAQQLVLLPGSGLNHVALVPISRMTGVMDRLRAAGWAPRS